VSARQLLTVLARCAELSRDPAFALRAGLRLRVNHFGLYGYALLSCPTPREAIQLAVRYRALATPLLGLEARESSTDLRWSFSDLHGLGQGSELFRLACEIQFSTQLSLHRDVMGADIRPCEVRAAYAAPPHAALYESLLGCPVHFGAGLSDIAFDAKWLAQPIALGHPIPASLIRATCERLLADLQPASGTASQVCTLLLAQPGRFPDIELLAQRLGMSSRTLRRKLLMEGTSYQHLLDGVRHRLATDYLSTTRLNTEDVAAALGFSDAANFRQAFKRWTGRRPSDFRPLDLRRDRPDA
jgi:AraC-like DNA-binding protein